MANTTTRTASARPGGDYWLAQVGSTYRMIQSATRPPEGDVGEDRQQKVFGPFESSEAARGRFELFQRAYPGTQLTLEEGK